MATQKGSLLLLKLEIKPNEFKTIGGMRTTKFVLNNQLINGSNKSSGSWRNLLSEVGISSATISVSGIFTDNDSENLVRDLAFNNKIAKYQLCFGNGEIITGFFQILSYERSGNFDQEENYNITFESSGEIEFKAKKNLDNEDNKNIQHG